MVLDSSLSSVEHTYGTEGWVWARLGLVSMGLKEGVAYVRMTVVIVFTMVVH